MAGAGALPPYRGRAETEAARASWAAAWSALGAARAAARLASFAARPDAVAALAEAAEAAQTALSALGVRSRRRGGARRRRPCADPEAEQQPSCGPFHDAPSSGQDVILAGGKWEVLSGSINGDLADEPILGTDVSEYDADYACSGWDERLPAALLCEPAGHPGQPPESHGCDCTTLLDSLINVTDVSEHPVGDWDGEHVSTGAAAGQEAMTCERLEEEVSPGVPRELGPGSRPPAERPERNAVSASCGSGLGSGAGPEEIKRRARWLNDPDFHFVLGQCPVDQQAEVIEAMLGTSAARAINYPKGVDSAGCPPALQGEAGAGLQRGRGPGGRAPAERPAQGPVNASRGSGLSTGAGHGKIEKRVSWLNEVVFSANPIDCEAIAAMKCMGNGRAIKLLKELEKKGDKVWDPSGYLKKVARQTALAPPDSPASTTSAFTKPTEGQSMGTGAAVSKALRRVSWLGDSSDFPTLG